MITRAQPIDVLFVIVPHSLLLDIAGPAEAFRLANRHRELHGLPPRFRLRFASPAPTQDTSVGLAIAGLEPLPEKLAATRGSSSSASRPSTSTTGRPPSRRRRAG